MTPWKQQSRFRKFAPYGAALASNERDFSRHCFILIKTALIRLQCPGLSARSPPRRLLK